VALGDELILGASVDTNTSWLARELLGLGIENTRTLVAGDDEADAAEALRLAFAAAPLVIVTGGLGPTEDDQTRHAAARVFSRELVFSDEAWQGVVAWFERRGTEIPAANRRQALLPARAQVLRNLTGTAPGFAIEEAGRLLLALPGPPAEMRAMFTDAVRPRLLARVQGGLAQRSFQIQGLPEARFAEEVGEWMARGANPLIGCSVKDGILSVTLRARAADPDRAQALADSRAAQFRERFQRYIFHEGPEPVEEVLGGLLIARRLSVSAAESCTAGLAAAQLARVPGISAVLGATFVTYSNAAKMEVLGVRAETLASHGAVSEQVVAEMALGAARRAGARAALAISGIAGPGGGTPEKPVGSVALGTAVDGRVETRLVRLPPTTRESVRAGAANLALVELLRRLLRGEGPA
jgi:nicotinamide-nucleotide amidase